MPSHLLGFERSSLGQGFADAFGALAQRPIPVAFEIIVLLAKVARKREKARKELTRNQNRLLP